jgi:hypothetical protein
MSAEIISWWLFLCSVSGLNILAWLLSATVLRRRQGVLSAVVYSSRRMQLFLSSGYVFGCAFRSALPVYDVQRICLYDSWLSSVIVGRSVATFAELCFVIQWALLLREISRATNSTIGINASVAIVSLIVIAEMCSWYSVLTTSNFGHVAEESLWSLSVLILVTSLISIRARFPAALRPVLTLVCVAGIAYIVFMLLVDVPMYWSRWIGDEASGRHYLTITQGIHDASEHWVVSHRWEDWKNEIAWMSMYFSVAVWLSIALIHTPELEFQTAVGKRNFKGIPT